MEFAVVVVTISFLIYNYKKEQQVKRERQEYLDRLMCKDIQEYKGLDKSNEAYNPITVTEEQEYYMELEENKR